MDNFVCWFNTKHIFFKLLESQCVILQTNPLCLTERKVDSKDVALYNPHYIYVHLHIYTIRKLIENKLNKFGLQ